MNCVKAQDLFSAYMENAMDSQERARFEQHLAGCAVCREAYDRFNAAIMLVEELPEVDTPPDFHASVMACVQQARNTAPRRVSWWQIDWQHVFTVRVPARAVAMGFAALLLFAMVIQLGGVNTITAGLMPWQRSTSETTIGIGDDYTPSEWSPWTVENAASASGPTVAVRVNSATSDSTSYSFRLSTEGTETAQYKVYLLPNEFYGGPSGDSIGKLHASGAVAPGKTSTVNLTVSSKDNGSKGTVARILWRYDGGAKVQFAFLPTVFDENAVQSSVNMMARGKTVYSLLKQVSTRFGVVVMASGPVDKVVDNFAMNGGNPEDALYRCVANTGFEWQKLAPSVYVVDVAE